MRVQCVEAKVQRAPVVVSLPDGSKKRIFPRIGAYVELDDGHKITCPDGQVRKGTGTVFRYNFRHGTWSVQPPQRCQQTRMGYVFTAGQPAWELPKRETGMTDTQFRRAYAPALVALVWNAVASHMG